jgi:hypothetical protein
MNPVCFRRIAVITLLATPDFALGGARFGDVIEDDHVEAPVSALWRQAGRWRELLPADPGLVAVLRLTVAVLIVTVLLWALR